jgi:hypothetical protein
MNQGDLSKREIIKYVRNMLKENSAINQAFDCFGKLNDFFINFMVSLQKYKLKKVSCEKI